MRGYIEQRVIQVANYILETGTTVREAAKQFGVSKSTVHKDVCATLAKIEFAAVSQGARCAGEKQGGEAFARRRSNPQKIYGLPGLMLRGGFYKADKQEERTKNVVCSSLCLNAEGDTL